MISGEVDERTFVRGGGGGGEGGGVSNMCADRRRPLLEERIEELTL